MVNGTISFLTQLKNHPGENFKTLNTVVDGLMDQQFTMKKATEDQMEDFMSNIYEKFIGNIITNLATRFPDLPLIQHFGVFDASVFPEEISGHGREEINALATHMGFNIDKTLEEWEQMKHIISQTPSLVDAMADQVMASISKMDVSHPNLHKLAAVGMLLPTSTADCERGFPTLKRVKTTHRNSLSNKVLNALLAITMQGPSLADFNLDKAVDDWFGEKNRRSAL